MAIALAYNVVHKEKWLNKIRRWGNHSGWKLGATKEIIPCKLEKVTQSRDGEGLWGRGIDIESLDRGL